jgi:uncharacterized damage-inducible protein DinB
VPTREEIIAKLDKERTKLVDRFRSLPAEDLTRPCTESEVDGADAWAAKDHLAHLAMIERAFQAMIRRTLDGSSNPVGSDFTRGRDAAIARVHRANQDNVEAHRADDLDALLDDLDAARADTRSLLDSLTDEQLTRPVPGAPWMDGTIGGVILTNAYHEAQHWAWVEEGLREA